MMALVVAAIGLAIVAEGSTRRAGWQALASGLLAVCAGAAIHLVQGARWPLFGAVALGVGIGWLLRTAVPRRAWPHVVIASACFVPLAVFTLHWSLTTRPLDTAVPPLVSDALAGVVAALLLTVPLLSSYFAGAEDALQARLSKLSAQKRLNNQVTPQLERALVLRTAIADLLPPEEREADEVRRRVDSLCSQMLDLAGRHALLHGEARSVDATDLATRADMLRERADEAADLVVADEYRSGAEALDLQREQAASVQRAAERIVARLHHSVATLENVRLGLAGTQGGMAEQAGWDLAPALSALRERAEERTTDSDATAEAGQPVASLPPPKDMN